MNLLEKGIAVAGSTTIDTIIARDHRTLKMGGVTTYAGITYRRHGIPVFVISNISDRDPEIMERLQTEGLQVFSAASAFSTRFVNDIRKAIRRQELLQRAESIKTSQIHSIIEKVDFLHLGPLHARDIEPGALDSLQNSKLFIFLDTQGYTRMVKNKRVRRSLADQMTAGLKLAHIAKANEAECKAILAFYKMSLSQLVDRFKLEEFVITLGDKGGFIHDHNGKTFHYKAAKAITAGDPTGAGDVFSAAYIVSRFKDQKNITDACSYAAAIAARQVEGTYITSGSLSLE